MSDTIKKELETNSLLEEAEELSIGAGATAVGKAGNLIVSSALTITTPISSANPRVSINLSCLTVVTRGGSRCVVKSALK